ncbi:hypothetical protein ACFFF5_05630 [Lederbergia wuyishanensis]|uniref:Uncharacterized protein n=1 Tax=Lederbergia wuyishanensis TaxID=1347903 RepID=A0ABU0CYS4_9BACI|nr:hypothetical protein [Lederbergia wuyishanensis]MCJ8005937.1 hypothetical protein [Lederbergia wuyishanensis]MDQ0341302.1 hypothetical protein [Lederbergia wuyishanensis]
MTQAKDYYENSTTQLYQGLFNDKSLSSEKRNAIKPTFYRITEEALKVAGGKLKSQNQ